MSFDYATVVALALAGDKVALFHAVEQAGNVWVVRDHALSDFPAGQSGATSAAQNAQHIELSAGKTAGFEYLCGLSAEGVSDLHEGDEQAGLCIAVRIFVGRGTQAVTIVVITTIVKVDS
ncbi:MAG: hypothetical protein QOJ41_2898 [Acidobacteriaceae bacterium]|jgi:hypothetical protein|nr:hypothetical protein [Acidobacteriaceae bacterium]